MDPATVAAAVRRFPLVGRPRPACPSLVERATDVVEIAAKAAEGNEDKMAEAAHALNLAALIASDCGMPELARQWCWRHINVYRRCQRRAAGPRPAARHVPVRHRKH